jgi:hypothetical protein
MKNVWICEVAEIADLRIWLICGFANLVDPAYYWTSLRFDCGFAWMIPLLIG